MWIRRIEVRTTATIFSNRSRIVAGLATANRVPLSACRNPRKRTMANVDR